MTGTHAVLRRLTGLRASLLEQISVSGGSFLFFLLAARLLGPADFGLFALHLVPAQIVHAVAVQWVLLPITTTPGTQPPARMLTAVTRRMVILIAAAPLFATVYASVAGFRGETVVFVLVVTGIFTALILFDVTRYLAIRCGKAALQATGNVVRWLTSYILLFSGAHLSIDHPLPTAGAFVLGILASLLISVGPVFRELQPGLQNQVPATAPPRPSDGRALLSLGLANALFTLVSTSALARSSLAAFGAFQTFRSLVNAAPLIIQYLETHFASNLARQGKTAFMSVKWALVFLGALIAGEAVILVFGEWLLSLTVGEEFIPFLWLLAVMYALVLVQSYTRTIGIEVRLSGAVIALWLQVILLVLSGCLIVGWMVVSESSIPISATISVIMAMAVLQALAMLWGLKLHRRNMTGG